MNSTDQTTDKTQKSRTNAFKFLTPLILFTAKIVNLDRFKEVFKPRYINVVFSQCGPIRAWQ
jgi:hypothetical protein